MQTSRQNKYYYPTTNSGEAIIIARDEKNNTSKMVFIKGRIKTPVITRVIDVGSDIDNIIKSYYLTELYEYGKNYRDAWELIEGITDEKLFIEYTYEDFETYRTIEQQRENDSKINRNDTKLQRRGKSSLNNIESVKYHDRNLEAMKQLEKVNRQLQRENTKLAEDLKLTKETIKSASVNTTGADNFIVYLK